MDHPRAGSDGTGGGAESPPPGRRAGQTHGAGRSGSSFANYRVETPPGAAEGLLRELGDDLAGGAVEIPGFPEIAMRINRALHEPDTSVADVVRLINSEPGLVSRILRLANAAIFNPGGRAIGDLKTAVSRVGFRNVWSVANSYSMQQLQRHEWLAPLRPWLAEVWLSSNAVAATCTVVSRRFRQLADEALVAGLLHRVGELYLLTHAQRRGIDLQSERGWDDVISKWQASVGEQIARSWSLPEHVAGAIGRQDAVANADLADLPPFAALLSGAKLYDRVRDRQGTAEASEAAELLGELRLWGSPFLGLVAEGAQEIEALRRQIS